MITKERLQRLLDARREYHHWMQGGLPEDPADQRHIAELANLLICSVPLLIAEVERLQGAAPAETPRIVTIAAKGGIA